MDDVEKQPVEEPTDPAEPEEEPFKAFSSKKEHDDYLEAKLKERLERKDKKLAEEKAETERKAREQALKDQEDWKKLAEERTETIEAKNKRIETLETVEGERDTLAGRIEALETRLKGILKPKLEQVPELFREFVEAKSPEEQAEWFEKNADKLDTNERPTGSRPTGRPSSKGADTEQAKEAREAHRSVSRI